MENNTVMTPGSAGENGGQNAWPREPAARTEIVAKTQEVAGQLAEQARQQMKSQLAQQKDRAAESVGSVAQALHTVGEQLRGQDQKVMAEYADSIAATADRFFGYLADKDIEQLAGEVEQFARRQPALFVTGAFALGFAASRFFKSSSPSNGHGYSAGARGNGTTDLRPLPAPDASAARSAPAYTAPSAAPAVPAPWGGGNSPDAGTPRE